MLDRKQFSKKTTNVCSNTPMVFNIITVSCFKAVALHHLSPVRILNCACCSTSIAINKTLSLLSSKEITQAGIYLPEVNYRSTRKSCEICLKLTIKIPE